MSQPFADTARAIAAAGPEFYAMAVKLDEHIAALHTAFGAPGDFGYGTAQGTALYGLYRDQGELRALIGRLRGAAAPAEPTDLPATPLLALPRETPPSTVTVLTELARERVDQVARGYDAAHDDAVRPGEWLAKLVDHHVGADAQLGGTGVLLDAAAYRRELLIIAALAIAAIEALDARPGGAAAGGGGGR